MLQELTQSYSGLMPDTTAGQTPLSAMSTGDLLALMVKMLADKDTVASLEKMVNAAKSAIENEVMERLRAGGITSMTGAGITVFVQKKETVEIDAERWPAILDKLIADGHKDLLQRRVRDAGIIELFGEGYQLPDGITIDSFDKVSHRRSTGK